MHQSTNSAIPQPLSDSTTRVSFYVYGIVALDGH